MSKYIAGKWKFKSTLNTTGLSFNNTNDTYPVNFSLITANGTSTTDYSYIITSYIPAESSPTGVEIKHLYFGTGVSGDAYYSVYDFVANEYLSSALYPNAIIDFGKSLQTIDDGLYEWITTNLDQEEINIEMSSPNGVELATEQKYCKVNIAVTPKLQEKTVAPGVSSQEVTADSGYVGLKKIMVTPSITDIPTATEMTALLVAKNIGNVYRFTGTTDDTYTNGDLYEVVS